MDLTDLDGSWATAVMPRVVALVTASQVAAAESGARYISELRDELNLADRAEGVAIPTAFAGIASNGAPLELALAGGLYDVKEQIALGVPKAAALRAGRMRLTQRVQLEVADAGRLGASVTAVADRTFTTYTRMLVPPSCSRCVILAGRTYGMQTAFQRHPRCDCRHVPSNETVAGDLTVDPRDYFASLTEAEQAKAFTKAGAQAIRDGADINQVVNARRGMYTTTTGAQNTRAGTTRRGMYGSSQTEFDKRTGNRMRTASRARPMPERIYALTAGDRDEAIRLLRYYRYIF